MDESEESRRKRLLESYENSGIYLFNATYGRLVSIAAAKGLGDGHAEDIAQEAFSTLFEKRPRLTNVEGWLVCVVRRRAVDLLRRRRTERRVMDRQSPAASNGSLNDPILKRRLECAVNSLSAGARDLLRHRYVAGRGETEAALAAGYAPSSFKQVLSRALRRLRSLLS